MNLSLNTLKNYIKNYLFEIRSQQIVPVPLIKGGEAAWGSIEHIDDLRFRIDDLIRRKKMQKIGSASRYSYQKFIEQLRSELRSAENFFNKNQQFISLTEGGAVGHLMHLYDDMDLTFGEIKNILSSAAQGRLEQITEKFDGMNLVISWDVQTNDLRAARNSSDIKKGGMDAAAIAQKFLDRGNVADAFNTAFQVLKDAIGSLSDQDKLLIFGPQSNVWYSAEIIYTLNPNVINYDNNSIIFHGWPIFENQNGNVITKSDQTGIDLLIKNIESMQRALTIRNWRINSPTLINLQKLSNGEILQNAISQIDAAMAMANVNDSSTIAEYLYSLMYEAISIFEVSALAKESIAKRCAKLENAPTLTAIKKMVPANLYDSISNFANTKAPALLKQFISPIEFAINDFAIEVLKGLNSSLINDSNAEVLRLRLVVQQAIAAIEASGNETAMTILSRQMNKLKNVENITSPMEGVVFIYKGNAYKFTGSFAAANQILGLFKYGRGNVKIQQEVI
jgi:hypothetical protein